MGRTNNKSTGTVFGTVIQAHAVQLPTAAPTAMAGLPPVDAEFTGRADDLVVLTDAMSTATVTVVSGLAGVGKTTLVLQAAAGFDGQAMFIDLDGYGSPVEAVVALSHLLTALGVLPEHIPSDQAACEVLYRSQLEARPEPLLILLDDAASAAQVRSLLPRAARHRVVITSRHTLAELNARLVELDVLPTEDAIALISRALIARRPDDPRIPTGELVELADRLPLALGIVAAVLADDVKLSISDMTELLRPSADRLDELRSPDGDSGVRLAFSLSYARLSAGEQRLFRLLSIASGNEVGIDHAAVLLGSDSKQARKLLNSLRRAHLLEHGRVHGRFRSHDLLRLYSVELAGSECDPAEVAAARERLVGHLAELSDDVVNGLAPSFGQSRFADGREAVEWLDLDLPMLVGLVEVGSRLEQHDVVAKLIPAVMTFTQLRGGWRDLLRLLRIGLVSAQRLEDRWLEGMLHHAIGYQLLRLGQPSAAARSFSSAREIFIDLKDGDGLAMSVTSAAALMKQNGDLDSAEEMYRAALVMYLKMASWEGIARMHFELGRIAHQRGDLSAAERSLLTAACLTTINEFPAAAANTMVELGVVQARLGQHETALSTFQRALQHAEIAGEVEATAEISSHLARIHFFALNDPGEAIRHLRRAKQLYLTMGENATADSVAEVITSLEDQVR
ncbi:tetratricopeptide repeat protein [Lentzea sp. E54]|uniref:tetratricopeptide repeat protein n=1 Tax=Lentzea xerophila TaxID=3435883 RepID=UPI003DA4DFF9